MMLLRSALLLTLTSQLLSSVKGACVSFVKYEFKNCTGEISEEVGPFDFSNEPNEVCVEGPFLNEPDFFGSIASQYCDVGTGTLKQTIFQNSTDCSGDGEDQVFQTSACLAGYLLKDPCTADPCDMPSAASTELTIPVMLIGTILVAIGWIP